MGKSSRRLSASPPSVSFFASIDSNPRKGLAVVVVSSLIAICYLLSDGASHYIRIVEASLAFDGFPDPMPDEKSNSGYEFGMRSIIFPSTGIDGMFWVEHAQRMVANGEWRVRRTDVDNSPIGREVHWSQAFLWWLILLGKIKHGITGESIAIGIESMAVFSNAILLLIFVIAIPFVVFRRFGAVATSLLVVATASSIGFSSAFSMGVPDHHGIAAASVLICAVFLLMGGGGRVGGTEKSIDVNAPYRSNTSVHIRVARRWFIASGVAGAVGLWVSAASALPCLASLGVGAWISSCFSRRVGRDETGYCPELWRLWGIAGCVGSLFFYLLEYFPNHMGLRLEVNHPFYSLAWLGGGEILTRLTRRQPISKLLGTTHLSKLVFGLAILALITPVALVMMIPERCFWISDHFLWKLHSDFIYEFDSLFVSASMPGNVRFLIWNFLPILFSLTLGCRVLLSSASSSFWKSNVALVLVGTVLLTLLGVYQIRWLVLANAFALVLLLPSVAGILNRIGNTKINFVEKPGIVIGAILAFGLMPILNVNAGFRQLQATTTLTAQEKSLIRIRHTAHFLRRMYPNRKLNVLAGPTTSTEMMYFAGSNSLGTLYWENLEGLKRAAEIFSAAGADEFLKLAVSRDVTHIVLTATDSFLDEYACLWRNLPSDAIINDTLLKSLLQTTDYPAWIRPIHVPLGALSKDSWVALFEIVPEQTEAEAWQHTGEFLRASNKPDLAVEKYRKSLAVEPGRRQAHIGLACSLIATKRQAEAWGELEKGLQGLAVQEGAAVCREAADYCFTQGFHIESMKLFERANEIEPSHPSTINGMAKLLAGSDDEKVRNVTKGLELAQGNDLLDDKCEYYRTIALAQAANGDFSRAVASIGRAIQSIDPRKFTQTTSGPESIFLDIERYHRGIPTVFQASK